jgi:small ligand-binding sensory domain FIST
MFGFPLDPERPSFEGEACVVRHLAGLEQAHHALVMPEPVPLHHTMSFMHRNGKAAERDMQRMVEGARARLSGPPDFGVYFDCAGRGQGLYGRNGVDSAAIRERLGEIPLIGMFGGYELATTLGSARMYTYTGVLVLVRVFA